MIRRALFSAVVGWVAVLADAATVAATVDAPDLGGVVTDAHMAPTGDAVDVLRNWSGNQAARPVTGGGAGVVAPVEWEHRFDDACVDDAGLVPESCDLRFGIPAPVCPEGQTPRAPMWARSRVPPSTVWSEWSLQDYGSCVGPVVPVLTAEDFRRLPLPAPVLHVQPDRDRVLVNVETIVYTDPSPVVLTTEVLGVPVTVEATPSSFAYDWGDGHATETRDPGRPYPAFDVFHEYEAPGRVVITLTTEWTGRYQVAGDPRWREVAGSATTSTTSREIDVEERTARLVSGTCFDEPDAPGCEGFDPYDVRR